MPIAMPIPRLGWNMDEGTFGGWLKKDGESVRAGEMLFILESEKGTEEVECLDSGLLRLSANGPKVGDRLAVGTVIGHLATSSDETLPERNAIPADAIPLPIESKPSAPREALDAERSGRSVSPRARRVARELGINPDAISGTGRGGRIRERDVRQSVHGLIPHTPIRRAIATRLMESVRATVPVTLTTTVDATNLVRLRERFRAAGHSDLLPSYTDLFVKLTAIALQVHPLLTGQWTEQGIRLPDAIHIGIAVDTENGLVVPVVRDVVSLGLPELAARTRELIHRANHGRLSAADMRGGCFTVSNLGSFGVDAFTPIINYPECAVLGIGRIAKRPAAVGDALVVQDQVTLSLTFDHRIVDGAPAARFLQTLSRAIEEPPPSAC